MRRAFGNFARKCFKSRPGALGETLRYDGTYAILRKSLVTHSLEGD